MVYADRDSSRRLYDDDYPSYEQLPRKFVARIESLSGEDGRSRARLFVNDEVTGDVLRDNAYVEDGYRFHDVFHVALAAGLGWSPVLRALLRRKRRSSPLVDEVEDGGRAIALDEAICLLVHDYAETNSFSLDPSAIDQEFVGLLRRLVNHLEVADRPNEDWWHTIQQATNAYHSIRNWGGGSLSVDLERGTLEAHAPESTPISV
jgi:hypothetical protein